MYSIELERFLKAIKQCQLDYQYYYDIVGKKDKETQDLLHQIELGEFKDRYKASTQLAKVRKSRREAKDIVENTLPIIEFVEKNKKVFNNLSNLLGTVRHVERSHHGRVYKAKIRDDLTI